MNSNTSKAVLSETREKYIVIKLSNDLIISVGNEVYIDKDYGSQSMRHLDSGEYFSASIEAMDLNYSQAVKEVDAF